MATKIIAVKVSTYEGNSKAAKTADIRAAQALLNDCFKEGYALMGSPVYVPIDGIAYLYYTLYQHEEPADATD